jgi:hypothetical protein
MMWELVFAFLLLFPFLLGFLHVRVNHRVKPALIYYRYFMTFNMILSSILVSVRMLFDGPAEAQLLSWDFSPIFYWYGVSLLSMALMGVFTLFSRRSIFLAPAILWAVFLMLSIITSFMGFTFHTLDASNIVIAHQFYNLISVFIMLYFLWVLGRDVQY